MISIKGLSFRYPEDPNYALRDITVEFNEGEIVLFTGPNGGGKSTLLKAILGIVPKMTGGTIKGERFFNGHSVSNYQTTQLAGTIGIVLQDPESQITNLTVEDEVRFGAANLVLPKSEVIRRSEDALGMMSISHLRKVSVLALSGGQMQRLSLASLLAMKPEVLLLDEPIANLDPHGVASVVEAIKQIRQRIKLMLISSHWLDPFIEFAQRIVIMDNGEIVVDALSTELSKNPQLLTQFGVQIPQAWQLSSVLENQGMHIPMGELLLERDWQIIPALPILTSTSREQLIRLDQVAFQYGRDGAKPLQDINFRVDIGSHLAIAGHNGEGKTTLARIMAGLLKPTSGQIQRGSRSMAMMLQKPTLGFLCNTLQEEVAFGSKGTAENADATLEQFDLLRFKHKSPFQLSAGEQRRLSLAIATANNPSLLILDEPTAELDARQVTFFLSLLKSFSGTVIYITHDTRVVGECVDNLIVIGHGMVLYHGHPWQLDHKTIKYLGYDQVNTSVRFAIDYLKTGIPLMPHQVEVKYRNCI